MRQSATREPRVASLEIEILRLERVRATFHVLGTTPLYMNRMPKKAREHLLLPPRRQNKAALEAVQKHDPPAEFRDSVYRCRDEHAPTMFHLPNNAFKKAMAQAAIDIPGATKAQVGRLVSVMDETVYLWGRPFLDMKIVRQAGINHAPDVRTRAFFPQWATKVTIGYIRRLIQEKDVLNLFAAAGMITGVGDGRTEKGSSDYGSWEVVGENDPRWQAIIKNQGRKLQAHAMANPEASDLDTEELLSWYQIEVKRRGDQVAPSPASKQANGRRRRKIEIGEEARA